MMSRVAVVLVDDSTEVRKDIRFVSFTGLESYRIWYLSYRVQYLRYRK